MKNIAIIIDCWKDKGGYWGSKRAWVEQHDIGVPHGNFPLHHNIINLISANQSIDTVILASYQISPDEFNTNTLWYINFKNFNYSKTFTNPIVKTEMCRALKYPGLNPPDDTSEGSKQRTCNCILHKVWSDKFQIAAFHPHQLELDNIKNVYFFGEAWDICVRKRAMGYTWWIENTNTNLFVYRNGIKCYIHDINTEHWNLVLKTWKSKNANGLYKFNRKFTTEYSYTKANGNAIC